MDKVVFSSLIAIDGMLTSHCDNLLTHHYHITYHPCFDTARPHDNVFMLLPCQPEKSKSDRAALWYSEKKTRKLF